MSKTFPEKILRKSISVFPRFFLFYCDFRCCLVTGVKRHYRKRFAKKLCRKVFQKIDQKIQNLFFLDFFNHVFGRFSVRGVQKHDKKNSKKNLTNPGTFLASEEPTNHVGARRFFLSAPCLVSPGLPGLKARGLIPETLEKPQSKTSR